MPLETPHADYNAYYPAWQRIRDCFAGEDSVKARGVVYLPKLGGQDDAAYDAYKARAMFYGAAGRTLDGLHGAIFRKEPEITLPTQMEALHSNVDLAGTSLEDFSRIVTKHVAAVGRYGVLTEMPEKGVRAYLVGYTAENIINWRTRVVDSVTILDQVVLKEEYVRPAEDGFGSEISDRYRVLELDESGAYFQRVFTKLQNGELSEEVIEPMNRGQRLGFIPFSFIGPFALSADIQKPILLDLVNVNLSHYRTSADLEHGCHWTALPTPWVAGLDENTGALHIGSQTAWLIPTSAQCGMLEFTGAGLAALEKRLDAKEKLMVQLGARLLEDQKKAAETAESKKLQYSGENSILATLANTVSNGLTENLRWAALWMGVRVGEDELSCKLNTDFFDAEMSPDQIQAFIAAHQSGLMSRLTVLRNFQQGELLPPGVTAEDEAEAIDEEGPALGMLPADLVPPDTEVVDDAGAKS